MKPTSEQTRVIETEGQALFVEAGAGTGKTWSLVERFIHLLETRPDWTLDSIIAITFTIKSAREMRSRVRKAIEQKALKDPSDSIWQTHRRNLDRIQISTIHSFCTRILRENAIAAQIDPKFEVLDETQAGLLREKAVREAIKKLVDTHHPALEILDSLTVSDLQGEMINLISERGILRRLFDGLPDVSQLLEMWKLGLEEMRKALWEQQLAENDDLIIAIQEIPLVNILDPTDKLVGVVVNAKKGIETLSDDGFVLAMERWKEIDLRGGKQDNWDGKEALDDLKALLRVLRETARGIEKAGALQEISEYDYQAAQHLQLWRQIWDELNTVYDQLKDEQQGLDFDDLEYQTLKLLQIKPRPLRLQSFLDGIKHLMVDEFQDTNPVQMEIVTFLAPFNEAGKLFTVGDAKQSIYRFRQAQVGFFNRTAQEIQKVTHQEPLPLSTSFRSHKRLIEALNDLFNVILQPITGENHQVFEAHPGPLVADRKGEEAPSPCVEIMLLPENDLEDNTISAEDARIAEGAWIAQRILQLKMNAMKVWDKELNSYRNFEYRDAAVLFRATTNLPLYEAEFKAAAVPYLTSSGRGYYVRPEVQDLVALLHALYNPQDDLNLAAALRSPLFSLSDETLYRLRLINPDGSMAEKSIPLRIALSQPPINDQADLVRRTFEILESLWPIAGCVNVWQLLRTALDLTNYEVVLAVNDGETGRKLSNVQKFMAQARDQLNLALGDFLAQLRDLKEREAREGEALGREPESGAVQLMSIHAAKGLEFPVIFLADIGSNKFGRNRSPYLLHDPEFGMACKLRDEKGDWIKPDPAGFTWAKWMDNSLKIAESKRLLYVACTRAADMLILSGQPGEKNSWLPEILGGWQIDVEGDEIEEYAYDRYKIRVVRQRELPEPLEQIEQTISSRQHIEDIPLLAQSLASKESPRSISVTDLITEVQKEKGGISQIKPVVWDSEQPSFEEYIPGHILGNVVHHVLNKRFFFEITSDNLMTILERFSKQEGLTGKQINKATIKLKNMLTKFRGHPLFEQIRTAKQCQFELPFNWLSEKGMIHGIVDLLYQDQSDHWHLIDWKTDYATEGNLAELKEKYLLQISMYYYAISNILNISPEITLVFLNPSPIIVDVSPIRPNFISI